MRIAIVSPGGVGGAYGGWLAKAGEEVVALARGAHLAAIRDTGLRVEGPRGDDTVRIAASDRAEELGIADIVLFAVKLYQAESAARAAAPLFGKETLGISLLNGIGGPEIIAAQLPGRTILSGAAYVSGVIAAPGHIRTTGPMTAIAFGAPEGESARARAEDFAARARRAGIATEISEDVRVVLWAKLVGLACNAALTAAARLPAGLIYHDPEILEVARALMTETAAVARAAGVPLPETIVEDWVARSLAFPPGMYASMAHDLMKGNPIEVDGFSGHVLREGRRLGIPTPHHAALYAVLKPHRNGTPRLP